MFWSKIWFFLIALVACITLTIALLMPKPAQRAAIVAQKQTISRACSVTEILLRDSARSRVQLASGLAGKLTDAHIDDVLLNASKGEVISDDAHASAKTYLTGLNFGKGNEQFAARADVILFDLRGRVVARSSKDANNKEAAEFGDSMAGYFAVDDALDGYIRDDVWASDNHMYLVAGSPVITRTLDWAGALVIRESIDTDFASELAKRLDVHVSFFYPGTQKKVASSTEVDLELATHVASLPPPNPEVSDCAAQPPFSASSGDTSYWVQLARLPGEAGSMGAFYAVFVEKPADLGFSGTLSAISKDDMNFGNFPWHLVGGLLVVGLLGGLGLMWFEHDGPLKKLSADSVALAKGDNARLAEETYRGKLGSIARSVNIAVDKLQRDAKAAKKDFDQLLGPMPGDELLGPATGGKRNTLAPPSPADFRFGGGTPAQSPKGSSSAVGAGRGRISVETPNAGADLFEFESNQLVSDVKPPTDRQIVPTPVSLPQLGTHKKPPIPSAAMGGTPKPSLPIPKKPTQAMAAVSLPEPAIQASNNDAGFLDDDILGGRGGVAMDTTPPSYSAPYVATAETVRHDRQTADPFGGGNTDGGDEDAFSDEKTRVAAGMSNPPPVDIGDDEAEYEGVFQEFLAAKEQCGESIENLTFDKFLRKLRNNRDVLIAKHSCRTVRFQVYVKDGKAALKASPVR